MLKCNLCYDRTAQGKGPMCATVCPTQAIFYGTYEEWLAAGRAEQGAKPINTFYFGQQRVRTRNYVVMTREDEALDLAALAEEASLGKPGTIPEPTATRDAEAWVEADAAGIPQRAIPALPVSPPNRSQRTPPLHLSRFRWCASIHHKRDWRNMMAQEVNPKDERSPAPLSELEETQSPWEKQLRPPQMPTKSGVPNFPTAGTKMK